MLLSLFLFLLIVLLTYTHTPVFVLLEVLMSVLSMVLSAAYSSLIKKVYLALMHKSTSPAVTSAPMSLLQPLVNSLKVLIKEPCLPSKSKKIYFLLSPAYTFSMSMLVFTKLPMDVYTYTFIDYKMTIFSFMALLSMSNHSVLMSNYFSNNKIAHMSSLKSTILSMSYSLSTFLMLLSSMFMCGSLNFSNILFKQSSSTSLLLPLLPLAMLYMMTMLTEMKKMPFDVAKSKAKLSSDYMMEYSSMNFALLVLSKYIYMMTASMVFIMLFTKNTSLTLFGFKLTVLLFGYLTMRSVLPNLSFDQMMELH